RFADPRVRQAFAHAINKRELIDGVVLGLAREAHGPIRPNTWAFTDRVKRYEYDPERAKALLKEAGVPNPSFTMMTPTTADGQRIAQVVQAMVKEAGFDVKIQSTEFATSLNMADKGDFEAYVLAWSGRADPDGNLYSFNACKQPLNYSGYCVPEVDALLDRSRSERDPAERKKAYEQIAARVLKDRPIVYLYHRNWLWAYNAKLTGMRSIPDGLLRVTGLKLTDVR
ncbi:MAG TPA: ABC transporter substrate-binding protein, partial [Caldimonas sp.]|nr:ABC transporter substrate-binding protein [Caldimonas sp.]